MIASVALLLGSRMIWYVALVFGIGCAGIIGRTQVHTSAALDRAEKKIVEAQKRTEEIEQGEGEHGEKPAPAGTPAPHGE